MPFPDAGDVAAQFFAAVEAGDRDTAAALYADDIVVWHNTDNVEQSKATNVAVMTWFIDNTSARAYGNVRRTVTESGFVQQHDLVVTTLAGKTTTIPVCVVARVRDGQITRLDEYLDSATVTAAVS